MPAPASLPAAMRAQYTVRKKLTIPLRLFGTDKERRMYPPTLHVTAVFRGEPADMGRLILKYEDSNGKARLNVSNTGGVLQRFRAHRISGWTLLPSGDAVMFVVPPREASPSLSGSGSPAFDNDDDDVGDGCCCDDDGDGGGGGCGGRGDRSLEGLLQAAEALEEEVDPEGPPGGVGGGSGAPDSPTAVGALPLLLAATAAMESLGGADALDLGGSGGITVAPSYLQPKPEEGEAASEEGHEDGEGEADNGDKRTMLPSAELPWGSHTDQQVSTVLPRPALCWDDVLDAAEQNPLPVYASLFPDIFPLAGRTARTEPPTQH